MIIYNAIRTPDGTVIESKYRWDYQAHTDSNGQVYAVDGGHDYLRRIGPFDYTELSVTTDDEHEVIRKLFTWKTYGESGKDDPIYVKLKDMTQDHIYAILCTQSHIKGTEVEGVFRDELEYRKLNNI